MRFKNVAVVMGGTSRERDVSLVSGRAIAQALTDIGYTVIPVILDADAIDGLPHAVDAVFIALHGGYGENGGIQADLDARGIPYTGSGAAASRLAMDKVATKRVLQAAGIPTAAYEVLPRGNDHATLPLPLVVKPPCDGSSLGVGLVRQSDSWASALAQARRGDPQGCVLVEAYIPGREWTVGILIDEALPVVEICAPDGWYDFEAKYTVGKTQYVFPDAPADQVLTARCRELALQAFRATGCRSLGRVDFRVTPAGEPFVLEINTVPGFTATSLVPKAATRRGIAFPQVCATILEAARYG